MNIHPTAVVEDGAEIGKGTKIGAFCHVGAEVRLGQNCDVRHQASISGNTMVGDDCVFFPNCVIGESPQDLKYAGEDTQIIIGDDNHFREFVTVHPGTAIGGGVTRLGNHNRIMVGVHVAHDCQLGNHDIISNSVQIAGHVHIEDCVTIGGQAGIHQFVTIGRYAMIGGMSPVTADVAPYMITKGYPPRVRGLNVPGLHRWQLAEDDVQQLQESYRQLFAKRRGCEDVFDTRLQDLEKLNGHNEHVAYLCHFLRRTNSAGLSGRFLETQRRDTPADNRAFFDKKQDAAGDPDVVHSAKTEGAS